MEIEKPVIIKVKYIRPIKPIDILTKGDWVDLRSGIDIDLREGDFAIIPLGVAVQLPDGYEAIIAPRSSTFKKWGIIQTNSIGIIDEAYRGDNDEWCLPVIAMRHTHIHMNDRICQFRIIKHQPIMALNEVKELGNPDRKGFGSTGSC